MGNLLSGEDIFTSTSSNLKSTNVKSTNAKSTNAKSTNVKSTNVKSTNLQISNVKSTNVKSSNVQISNIKSKNDREEQILIPSSSLPSPPMQKYASSVSLPLTSSTFNSSIEIPASASLPNIATPSESDIVGFSFEYTHFCNFILHPECCICLTEYEIGNVIHMLPCNHIFHRSCIVSWINKQNRCPICKSY